MSGKPWETPGHGVDEPVGAGFGEELRRWRTKRGLSLSGLARLVHYSKGYLSKLENGEKPPNADIARCCDEALETGGALAALIPASVAIPSQAGPPDSGLCPFRGLAAFTAADARWFFGRETAVAELVERMADCLDKGVPVTVVAPSGAGKSSLLRAGLLPALARGVLPRPDAREWPVVVCTPTADPPAALERGLAQVDDDRFVLVIDQFEEAFALCQDDAVRQGFLDEVCALARRVPVVLGVRADFYGRMLAHPGLARSVREGQVALGPMSSDDVRIAITRPAVLAGLGWEPGLVEVLLTDLGVGPGGTGSYEPGALPLLAHALLTTWQNREGAVLTVAGYRRTGGLRAAVATTAERVYAQLDDGGKDTARRLLLRLVQVGRDAGQTRRRASMDQLSRHLPGATLGAVVAEFVRARLLTTDSGGIEITHEALLSAWPRLRDWIEADRAGLHVQQRLAEAAEAWEERGHGRDALYQGASLAVATAWSADHPDELTPVERVFLAESTRERRRGIRRLRRLVALLSVLVVLAVAASGVALWQGDRAARSLDAAVSQRVAGRAADLRESDPALAAQLALAAHRLSDTLESRGAVLSSAPPLPSRYRTGGDWVRSVAPSSDGRLLAVSAADGDVQLWDLTQPRHSRPLAKIPASGRVPRVVFRPGSPHELLVVDGDGARLWNVAGLPTEVASFPSRAAVDASFSADGDLLATTTSADRTARVWRLSEPEHPMATIRAPDNGHGVGTAVALSPDGATLLTGGSEGRYALWNVAGGTLIAGGGHGGDHLARVVFSPDGHRIAMGDVGYDVWLHELDASRVPRPALRLSVGNQVWGLAFSPDSTVLATSSNDRAVRLWDTRVGTELARLPHPRRVPSVAFAHDGSSLVAGGVDGAFSLWPDPLARIAVRDDVIRGLTVDRDRRLAVTTGTTSAQLWDIADPTRHLYLGRTPPVPIRRAMTAAAISADRASLATIDYGAGVVLWDIRDPHAPLAMSRRDIPGANTVAFAPGGKLMVTGDNLGLAIIWDIRDPHAPNKIATLDDDFDDINAIVFTADGKTMATADTSGGVRLWDMTDPAAPRQTAHHGDHTEAVVGLRFTPDERALISTSYDWTIRIWDLTTMNRTVLTGHSGAVSAPDISPDGRTLLTTGSDGTARLWDIADPRTPRPTATLAGRERGGATFAADGRAILSTGPHTFRTWTTDVAAAADHICATAGTTLTDIEWAEHFGDLPYDPPCP